METKGKYNVYVFDDEGVKIDERRSILAWTRREAYCDVQNEMKPHKKWDAERQEDNQNTD